VNAQLHFIARSQVKPHVAQVLRTLWHEVCWYESPKTPEATLDVYIVGEKKIRTVNKEYRGVDKVTDVVSLDFGIDELGQKVAVIYICNAVLKRVAHKMKHDFEQELVFITLHGMLHVWGHDHEHVDEEKVMLKRKEMLLQNFPRYSPLLSTYRSRFLFDS
jgi:probable rRNA maturation factor